MSTPGPAGVPPAQDARARLGAQLASLRHDAGLTQRETGRLTGYSRSAVARAEASGACSRQFALRAGRALGAGDDLARAHDRVTALTAAARSQAARRARHQRRPPTPSAEDTDTLVLARDSTCPHCGKPVAVLLRQDLSLLPLEAA